MLPSSSWTRDQQARIQSENLPLQACKNNDKGRYQRYIDTVSIYHGNLWRAVGRSTGGKGQRIGRYWQDIASFFCSATSSSMPGPTSKCATFCAMIARNLISEGKPGRTTNYDRRHPISTTGRIAAEAHPLRYDKSAGKRSRLRKLHRGAMPKPRHRDSQLRQGSRPTQSHRADSRRGPGLRRCCSTGMSMSSAPPTKIGGIRLFPAISPTA